LFTAVIMNFAITLICYFFTSAISGGSYGGFSFATAENLDTAMIYCNMAALLYVFSE